MTKKTTKKLTQQEQKEADAKFLLELQKAQADDLSDAVPIAKKLFGDNVDPLVIIQISDRMFDKNGEIDEKKLASDINMARVISVAIFGEIAGNRPDVIVGVYDKAVNVLNDEDEEDEEDEDEEDEE